MTLSLSLPRHNVSASCLLNSLLTLSILYYNLNDQNNPPLTTCWFLPWGHVFYDDWEKKDLEKNISLQIQFYTAIWWKYKYHQIPSCSIWWKLQYDPIGTPQAGLHIFANTLTEKCSCDLSVSWNEPLQIYEFYLVEPHLGQMNPLRGCGPRVSSTANDRSSRQDVSQTTSTQSSGFDRGLWPLEKYSFVSPLFLFRGFFSWLQRSLTDVPLAQQQ